MSKCIYTQEQFDKILEERNELANENFKLKQHLVEKDRQIEQLKKFDDLNKTFFDLFRTAFKEPNKIDDLFNTLKTMQEKQDQYKISFALEQLEKVKEKVICGVMDISNNYWSCFVKDGSQYMTSEDLYDALEQEFIHQIEELKKEMNNV